MRSRIVIYADECNYDTWKEYCAICNVDRSATSISIIFDEKDVEATYDEDDEDEEEYVPSAESGDYSPSNPWDAPGMSINDFI